MILQDENGIVRSDPKPLAESSPTNERYESVSAFLGIAQVILYLALLSYVVLTLVSNAQLLTYRNFYYFFKDLNASTKSVDFLETDSVTYNTDETQSFTLFRGGLAVAGNSSVTVFSATGREAICKNVSYQNPVAVGSGKYLIVYESGGKSYSVYNSYAQLKSDTFEHAITGVSVSDSGMYAIISSDQEYNAVVALYSDNFSLINRYSSQNYVTDVAINSKGNKVALMSCFVKNGSYQTEIRIYEPKKTEVEKTVTLTGHLGVSCRFTDSGSLAVLCSDALFFVKANGKIQNQYDFYGELTVAARLQKDGAVLCLKESENSLNNRLLLFDKNGKTVYNKEVDGSVLDVGFSGNNLFLLYTDSVVKLSVVRGSVSTQSQRMNSPKLIVAGDNCVFVCSPQKSIYLTF